MKLTFLGTAAAEAVPAHFCICDTCRTARKNGGKDIRKRCCYLLNDDTLIDYGPDIWTQSIMYGFDLADIKQIIFTHAHEDHLDPVELIWRSPGYSKVEEFIDIFGDARVHEKIAERVDYEKARMRQNQVCPGDVFSAGNLKFLALRADHDPASTPLNYVISDGDINILIANDTGFWDDSNWNYIKNYGKKLDLAVIECTGAVKVPLNRGHLGQNHTVLFRDKLAELGVLKENCRCITNHFSHNGAPLHSDMEDFFKPHGIEVAFDGLTVEI